MAEFAALPFAVQRQIVMKVHALVGYLDRDPKEAANLGSPYTDPCEPNSVYLRGAGAKLIPKISRVCIAD